MISRLVAGTLIAAGAVSLAACSTSKPRPVVTVTVPPSSSGSAGASGSSGPSGSSTGTASVADGAQTKLPGGCNDLLSDYSLAQAIGAGYTLGAQTAFVVGTADAGIGRLANINCRYGVTGTGATAKNKLEIGISLYTTESRASTRIAATTADFTTHGATVSEIVVGGERAQVLTGGTGAGYTDPTLVVAAGQRTIAITVGPTLATGAAATADATKVAQLAIAKSAG